MIVCTVVVISLHYATLLRNFGQMVYFNSFGVFSTRKQRGKTHNSVFTEVNSKETYLYTKHLWVSFLFLHTLTLIQSGFQYSVFYGCFQVKVKLYQNNLNIFMITVIKNFRRKTSYSLCSNLKVVHVQMCSVWLFVFHIVLYTTTLFYIQFFYGKDFHVSFPLFYTRNDNRETICNQSGCQFNSLKK